LNVPQEGIAGVTSTTRQAVDRWERGIQVPSRSAQRLIWLLERSIQGRPITLEALLTWADD